MEFIFLNADTFMWARGPSHWREMSAFKLLFLPEMNNSIDPPSLYWLDFNRLPDLQILLCWKHQCCRGITCSMLFPSSLWTACLVALVHEHPGQMPSYSCSYYLFSWNQLILLLKIWIWEWKIKLKAWEWGLGDLWRQECFILSSQK